MFDSGGGAAGAARFLLVDADLRAVVFLAGALAEAALLAVVFREAVRVAVVFRVVLPVDFRADVFAVAALRAVPVFAAGFRAGAFAFAFAVVFRVPVFADAALRVPEVFAAALRVAEAGEDFLAADFAAVLRVPVFAAVLRDALLAGAFAVFRLLARTAMACALGCSGVVSSVLTSEISFVPILIIAVRIEGRQPRARGTSCCWL
jgi:hypothetical protein